MKEIRLTILYVAMAAVLGYLGYTISGDSIFGAGIGALIGVLLIKWASPNVENRDK